MGPDLEIVHISFTDELLQIVFVCRIVGDIDTTSCTIYVHTESTHCQ